MKINWVFQHYYLSVQFRCTTLGFPLSLGFKNDAMIPYRVCTNGILHLDAPATEKIRIDFIDETAKWRSIAWKFVYPFLLLCILFAVYILYGSLSMLGCIIFTVVAAIVCALIFHFRFGWFLDISKEDLLNCFSELIVTNASAVFQVPLRTTAVQAKEDDT